MLKKYFAKVCGINNYSVFIKNEFQRYITRQEFTELLDLHLDSSDWHEDTAAIEVKKWITQLYASLNSELIVKFNDNQKSW